MKPTISIALITLGLTFPAPALAVDYVQCEAMKRRFYADTQEQKERADQARRDTGAELLHQPNQPLMRTA